MEEDQVVEQQDDLERMIAHMRAEALKRGKDWLRAKMEDKNMEPTEREDETTAPTSLTDKAAERASLPPQKPGRRQRSEGKQARKPTKKARAVFQSTDDETTVTPEASRPRAPAEAQGTVVAVSGSDRSRESPRHSASYTQRCKRRQAAGSRDSTYVAWPGSTKQVPAAPHVRADYRVRPAIEDRPIQCA
ncbi:hypothetical protein NDU88_009648 [Pleurodeles waltl]|uniref:Uncharacterized protein n=1 Tax=Pleurodeles waltl TaxID=8319 RepID=A0AAV7PTE0_PLEWA|nr:hypothetical protein NDU88_009648 [Pleurodeles waltl]